MYSVKEPDAGTPARTTDQQVTLEIDGRTVPLSAGMSVSAEVKIGTRRVIDFVLAPLISHATEGLRER
jgi:hemolysin D